MYHSSGTPVSQSQTSPHYMCMTNKETQDNTISLFSYLVLDQLTHKASTHLAICLSVCMSVCMSVCNLYVGFLDYFFVVSLTFQSTVSLLVVPVLAAISVQCAEEDAASSYEPSETKT